LKAIDHPTVVAAGKCQRRTFTQDFKRDLVAQTLVPGASVSAIALGNGINTNQLFAWRRQLQAPITAQAVPALLPVHLDLSDIDMRMLIPRSQQ
jgi:transposase-like protein